MVSIILIERESIMSSKIFQIFQSRLDSLNRFCCLQLLQSHNFMSTFATVLHIKVLNSRTYLCFVFNK